MGISYANSAKYGKPADMIASFVPGVRNTGEILATWATDPQDVVNGWMASPEHQQLMLAAKFTHIGVGAVIGANGNTYWVQHLAGF